jgi:hypothetical protein
MALIDYMGEWVQKKESRENARKKSGRTYITA